MTAPAPAIPRANARFNLLLLELEAALESAHEADGAHARGDHFSWQLHHHRAIRSRLGTVSLLGNARWLTPNDRSRVLDLMAGLDRQLGL